MVVKVVGERKHSNGHRPVTRGITGCVRPSANAKGSSYKVRAQPPQSVKILNRPTSLPMQANVSPLRDPLRRPPIWQLEYLSSVQVGGA